MNIEDLKCCGNCKYYDDIYFLCSLNNPFLITKRKEKYNLCDFWEFDNLIKEKRLKEKNYDSYL